MKARREGGSAREAQRNMIERSSRKEGEKAGKGGGVDMNPISVCNSATFQGKKKQVAIVN